MDQSATTKRCSYAGHQGPNPLPVSEFHRSRKDPSGYQGRCRSCAKVVRAAMYRSNPEKYRAQAAAHAAARAQAVVRKRCWGPECTRPAKTQGLCKGHYQQQWRGSELSLLPLGTESVCHAPECSNVPTARGLCNGHYQQWARGGELTVLRVTFRTDARDTQGRKRCSRCCDWLPVDEFYAQRSGAATRDGLSTNCNLCDRLIKYHITAREYREMFQRQGGRCAICKRMPKSELHVDHDHACCPERRSCGKCIRGLLCPDCNGALGLMADDADRLLSAASYLKEVSQEWRPSLSIAIIR